MLIKLLFYVVIVALLAVAAVWFASGTGEIIAAWQDYEITMSTANFVFATFIIIALLAIIIPMILGLFSAPFRWWRKRQDMKYKKGLQLVTETLAAISTGDAAHAEILMKRSAKLLHHQPIVPLLQAQLAGIKKNENQLQQAFQSMLEFSETKALGSKSLSTL
jgi:HemY protein